MNLPPLLLKTNNRASRQLFPAYTCSILEPIEHQKASSPLPENILDLFQHGLNRFCRECGCKEQCWKRGRARFGVEIGESCYSLCDFFHMIRNQTQQQFVRGHHKEMSNNCTSTRPDNDSGYPDDVRTDLFYSAETDVQIVRVSLRRSTTTQGDDGVVSGESGGVLWLSQLPIGRTFHIEMLYWPSSSQDIVPDLTHKPLCFTFDYFCSGHELLFQWREHDRDHEIRVLHRLFQGLQHTTNDSAKISTSPTMYFITSLQLPNLFLLDVQAFGVCLSSYVAVTSHLRRLMIRESRYVPRRSNSDFCDWETVIRASLKTLDEFSYYLPASSRYRQAATTEDLSRLLCGNRGMLRIQKLCEDRRRMWKRIRKLVAEEERRSSNNKNDIVPAIWPLLLGKMIRHRPISEVYELICSFHDRVIPRETVPCWEDLLSLSVLIVS